MDGDKQVETDENSGNITACLQSYQVSCVAVGQNSTFRHNACVDGGTYTYTLKWGDTTGDLIDSGIMLADDGTSLIYTHVYETEGIYDAFFKVEVAFEADGSKISTESSHLWKIGNTTCSLYSTESPTVSLAPSFAPSQAPTSGSSNRVHGAISSSSFPLTMTAAVSLLLLKKLVSH